MNGVLCLLFTQPSKGQAMWVWLVLLSQRKNRRYTFHLPPACRRCSPFPLRQTGSLDNGEVHVQMCELSIHFVPPMINVAISKRSVTFPSFALLILSLLKKRTRPNKNENKQKINKSQNTEKNHLPTL